MNKVYPLLKVFDIITNNPRAWNIEKMIKLFEQEIIKHMIWLPNHNGKFSVKTAYPLAATYTSFIILQDFLTPSLKNLLSLKIHDHHELLL